MVAQKVSQRQNSRPLITQRRLKGIVYKLYHPECPRIFYVGSTTQSKEKRRSVHSSYALIGDSLLYTTMRESGERERWVLEVLEEVDFTTKEDLETLEEIYRVRLGANLNTRRCRGTKSMTAREADRLNKEEVHRLAVETQQYHCDLCGTDSGSEQAFKRHILSRSHLRKVNCTETDRDRVKASGKFRCEICQKNLSTVVSLNNHLTCKKHLATLNEWEARRN